MTLDLGDYKSPGLVYHTGYLSINKHLSHTLFLSHASSRNIGKKENRGNHNRSALSCMYELFFRCWWSLL